MGQQGGGGFGFFLQGGGNTFCSMGEEGYCKIAKKPKKCTLRHIFHDFYLQHGENFLVTKGG